jgi:RNA polymerase sigma factor (sigma-70 family)
MTDRPKASAGQGNSREVKDGLVELLPHLRAFARGLCGRADRADDLVQEAVLRAWTARDTFVPGSNLKAWLFTIARNHFLNDLRRAKRETQLEEGQAEASLVSGADQEDGLNLGDLHRALNRLPPERREALLLVGASGFSYEEAAQVCGVAVGTIKSRVARGRGQLARILDESGKPPAQTSSG